MTDISTAGDFRKNAEERALGPAEPLTLPSGLVVMARRPTPFWWILRQGILPKSMAARAQNEEPGAWNSEETADFSKFLTSAIETVVIQPRIRRPAGPDEVDPGLISDTDTAFLIAWICGGETAADNGQGLSTFSRSAGRPTDRAGGPDMALPPE